MAVGRLVRFVASIASLILWSWSALGHAGQVLPVHSFAIHGDRFLLDGKPWVIRSGELHYPRVPRAEWRDRMRKMRAMGLNTLSTYVFWNLHEKTPGSFDFSGPLDVEAFILTAAEEGLMVILRPGPYVCAEWEFGGFPAWLLASPAVPVRQADPRFLAATDRYLKEVGKRLSPLLVEHGGPIILVQVENEYGSFGSDRPYMNAIRRSVEAAGFSGQLYTGDSVWQRPGVQRELGNGSFPDLPVAINFGQGVDPASAFNELDTFRPGLPKLVGEFWTGWFDHPGLPHATTGAASGAAGLSWLLDHDISFNLYMIQGGTSFGFMNGANVEAGIYLPDTTSYDYDAPLDEAGRPTAKFAAFRAAIAAHLSPGEVLPPLPEATPLVKIAPFAFREVAPLSQLLTSSVSAAQPLTMEDLGQNYGFVWYRHQVTSAYQGELSIPGVNDYALVAQGGKALGTLDRRYGESSLELELKAGEPLDILVENMGRINFSPALLHERKGLTSAVSTSDGELSDWQMYSLPFEDLSPLRFNPLTGVGPGPGPAFYRSSFTLTQLGDSFIDTHGWGKGVVFVNGHNLGRYWSIGPLTTLFCPRSWLQLGRNEVIAFDLHPPSAPTMQGLTDPLYN